MVWSGIFHKYHIFHSKCLDIHNVDVYLVWKTIIDWHGQRMVLAGSQGQLFLFDTPAKGGNLGDSEDITTRMPRTRQDEQRPLKLTVDKVSATVSGGIPCNMFFLTY